MQVFIDKGFSAEELEREENRLWNLINNIADSASMPPKTCAAFPESKLIGYGWEWAAYELSSKNRVIKVPSGFFPEVNEPEYLENTEYAYQVCRKFLRPFIVNSIFKRVKIGEGFYNTIEQRRISGKELHFIELQTVSKELRTSLSSLANGMLTLLSKHNWMPDMHLRKEKSGGKWGWNIRNLMVEEHKPIIFDFTAYYDVFRLYPVRTVQEKKTKGGAWEELLNELTNKLT